VNVKKDAIPNAKVDEEAERKWLSEMERVEASIFEGKKLAKMAKGTNRDIAAEYFSKEERRVGKNTTVMVDGFAISKESMNCGDWEAVPTMAGKDPRLAERKREKKPPITPQEHCQVCIDGGELHCCQLCPRAYHAQCLDREYQSKAKGWSFTCPQHRCFDCHQGTQDAGGMLYRCRWCERAYCEDCMDFDQTTLIGNTLQEYEVLGYPEVEQAFYIQCSSCTDNFKENPSNAKLCSDLADGINLAWEGKFGQISRETSTRPGSMTDATTVETTGMNTPMVPDEYMEYRDATPSSRKRKMQDPVASASKKSRIVV